MAFFQSYAPRTFRVSLHKCLSLFNAICVVTGKPYPWSPLNGVVARNSQEISAHFHNIKITNTSYNSKSVLVKNSAGARRSRACVRDGGQCQNGANFYEWMTYLNSRPTIQYAKNRENYVWVIQRSNTITREYFPLAINAYHRWSPVIHNSNEHITHWKQSPNLNGK
jgi:hypothetical protein